MENDPHFNEEWKHLIGALSAQIILNLIILIIALSSLLVSLCTKGIRWCYYIIIFKKILKLKKITIKTRFDFETI